MSGGANVGTPAGQAGFGSMQGLGEFAKRVQQRVRHARRIRFARETAASVAEFLWFAEHRSERQQWPAESERRRGHDRIRIRTRLLTVRPIRISRLRRHVELRRRQHHRHWQQDQPQVGDRLRKGDTTITCSNLSGIRRKTRWEWAAPAPEYAIRHRFAGRQPGQGVNGTNPGRLEFWRIELWRVQLRPALAKSQRRGPITAERQ